MEQVGSCSGAVRPRIASSSGRIVTVDAARVSSLVGRDAE
jgi:hypothetical protein